jgi:hypothetical protein
MLAACSLRRKWRAVLTGGEAARQRAAASHAAYLSEKARMDGSASDSASTSARDGRRRPPPRPRSVCRTRWAATRVAARQVRPGSSSSGRRAVMVSEARRASAAAGPPATARLKRTTVESARSGGAPAAVRKRTRGMSPGCRQRHSTTQRKY